MRLINTKEQRDTYISMLSYLDKYCTDNNLSYFLAYGSLLGAIRHKGFIPWDDDVDIFMPRKDYEELLRKHDNNGRYKVYHFTNNDTIVSRMIYLVDSFTYRKPSYSKSFVKNLGMNLDIFPIDNTPDNRIKRIIHRKRVSFYDWVFNMKVIPISPYRSRIKNMYLRILQLFLSPFSFNWLLPRLDSVASRYKNKNTYYCNCFYSPYDQKKSFITKDFSEAKRCQFENIVIRIPTGFDSILKTTYGDYMKLPPKENRLPHNDHMEYYIQE